VNSLNPEERELVNSVERGEWQSVDHLAEEIQRYQSYAENQMERQKIEVILSVEDAQKIQKLSQQLGQSISTLSQEILHKYLHGQLIEREQ